MTGKPQAGFPHMQISHDSLTRTPNPKTPVHLQLTSTPSTNVTVQADECNGGLMMDPRKFWHYQLLKIRSKIRIQKIQKIQI